ncbi:hypothetical protein JZ751_001855 [Albula glossodonta]|uniref:Uncharacterized protein n=1 Tax=Albula glossodonta TaxID=121402 RepID=A0A8T2PUJ4_9TELE|nr:hypothetical protein JZ751_001855 [Albula glossodonta]
MELLYDYLLMATDAPGTSVMSPMKVQSVWSSSLFSILSVLVLDWFPVSMSIMVPLPLALKPNPSTSSCHSTMAPGAISLWLGCSRRWNSLPKAVMLKNSLSLLSPDPWDTSLLTRCLWLAERRCDRNKTAANNGI